MLTKVRYSPRDMFLWTRWETAGFLIYALAILVANEVFDLRFLHLPWTPLAVVGTATAFIVGFQNNAAYGRIWEARKIWGGIVNTSRTFGMKVCDMVTNEHAKVPVSEDELAEHRQVLIHRHVGWLTALRHAMRQPKPWEEFEDHVTNREWSAMACIPERRGTLREDLAQTLPADEVEAVLAKRNKQGAILFLQSKHLRALKERGLLWEFSFLELENVLEELFTLQGKSERIKNFPYPRQYATLSFQFVRIFVLMLPFAVIPEFETIGEHVAERLPQLGAHFVWLAVPFCALISWIFHTMERIGRVGENPFEGSANDVPISTISRGIEIDLRQLLEEDDIPEQFPEQYNVQM
jgi:putative membrane protein